MRIRSVRNLLAAGVLAAGLLIPGASASAAGLPMPFTATVNGCSVQGGGEGPGRIVQRSATGARKISLTPTSTGSSWFAICANVALVPGDTLTFLDTSDPQHPTLIQKVTIPTFTAVTDRRLAKVTGIAKGASKVPVALQECLVFFIGCPTQDFGDIATGAGGSYTYAPAKAVTGLWQAVLTHSVGDLSLYLYAGFPRLLTTLGSAAVTGVASPGQAVVVRVDRAGHAAALTTAGSAWRTYQGATKRNGAARKLAAGDRVRWWLAGKLQADFTVPALDMDIKPAHTSGHCFPDAGVRVLATKPGGPDQAYAIGSTASDGTFDVSLSIPLGWNVVVECRTTMGDAVQLVGVAGG
ncbi:MAG: hypothetical protein U0869_19605 [Chloroflexota bacterium]